jgi:RNA polymerase sigma-70 factor (sigma-E family)
VEFDACFDSLYPRAFALALRMLGDPSAAEDVAAEALTRLYVRWPRLRDADYRDAWVMKVSGNLAIDVLRRRPPGVDGRAPRSVDAHDLAALRLALAAALIRLPRRQREAVTLRFFADMTEDQVAQSLGVSTGAVKSHVHRGLATLRQRMGDSFEEVQLHGD